MNLQTRLTILLAAFAVFALAATFGTVYGIRLHVEGAASSFERSQGDAVSLKDLRLQAREQYLLLREVVDGSRNLDEPYLAERDGFFARLQQTSQFGLARHQSIDTRGLLELTGTVEANFKRCATLVDDRQIEKARDLLERTRRQLLPALDRRLADAQGVLDEERRHSLDEVLTADTQILLVSVAIGVFGLGLVTAGTAMVRRWVILPVRELELAAREIGQGNLAARVIVKSEDELGQLGHTMNSMASSLAKTQAELRVSEAKYRSLFENLRDAAVVCDRSGMIIDCHPGDTNLLGPGADGAIGQPLLKHRPEWRAGAVDWLNLIHEVHSTGIQKRIPDIELLRQTDGDSSAIVDLVAYPVEFGNQRYVAIVLRDVTERRTLDQQIRRNEAMEATVTFARGVAHDFNNLLTIAIGTLTPLIEQTTDKPTHDRAQRVFQACKQAAALSRKLLEFASGDKGRPEVICLKETVELILESLDETFLAEVEVRTDFDPAVFVRVDPDQLTQVVLNLVCNARESMPDGGEMRILVAAEESSTTRRSGHASRLAILSVADTGRGMAVKELQHIFEPFYSAKQSSSGRSRGMGLAVVHSAVSNASGTIRVRSRQGGGSTFRVELPLCDASPEPPAIVLDRASSEAAANSGRSS